MNEEEKQDIIEFLRLFCKTKIDYCKLEKTDVLDILNYINKLQEENKNYKKLILDIKGKLNNIQFEVEQSWRKIEKLESKYE